MILQIQNLGHLIGNSDTENMHCYCFVLLAVAAIAGPALSHPSEFDDELKTQFDVSQRQCSEYFTSSIQKLWLLLFGKLGKDVETSPTKCWAACVLKKMGFMDRKPGNDTEMPLRLTAAEHLEEDSAECKAASRSANEDICESGYIYVQCMFQKWRQGFNRHPDTTSNSTEI